MDISKKDLLKETGISYGQLYRWKREGLIPEDWFVKKSSYTGQETYFPRELILNRIAAIQRLKDSYSLEELANVLSPEITNRIFSEEDIEKFEEIDVHVAATFMDEMEKDSFTFVEVLIMMCLSEWKTMSLIDDEQVQQMIIHMLNGLHTVCDVNQNLQLLKIANAYYTLFLANSHGGSILQLDDRIQVVANVSLQEKSNTMKVKYKDTFEFAFDEEVTK